jgi:hypothetical protein
VGLLARIDEREYLCGISCISDRSTIGVELGTDGFGCECLIDTTRGQNDKRQDAKSTEHCVISFFE